MSVFLALDLTADELCSAEPFIARYAKVRFSTVHRIRASGFALLAALGRPHYDVLLPDDTDATLARLEAAFDPAVPNPGRGRGRSGR